MTPANSTDRMPSETYVKGKMNAYDFCAEVRKQEEEVFLQCKAIADELLEDGW